MKGYKTSLKYASDMQEKNQMEKGNSDSKSDVGKIGSGELPTTTTFESTSGKNVSQVSYRKEPFYSTREK